MQKRFNPLKPEAAAAKPRPEPLKKGTIPTPIAVGPSPVLTESTENDGLELRFPKPPGPATLEMFHSTKDLPGDQRWHLHFKGRYWYAKRNDATRKFAEMLIALSSENIAQPGPSKSAFVPKIMPTPMELEWQVETKQGLTKLPYDVWLEKFLQAKGGTHPVKVEEPPKILPVTFAPLPAWKKRMQWASPMCTDGAGNPR